MSSLGATPRHNARAGARELTGLQYRHMGAHSCTQHAHQTRYPARMAQATPLENTYPCSSEAGWRSRNIGIRLLRPPQQQHTSNRRGTTAERRCRHHA